MNPSVLALPDVVQALTKLERLGFKAPATLVPADWLDAFRGITPAEFTAALDDWMRASETGYWPHPGQVLKHLKLQRPKGNIPASLVAPDDRTHGWYVIGIGKSGPRIRYLPHGTARARGIGRVEESECPDEGCHCFAVEVEMPPAAFGVSKVAAAVAEAFRRPRAFVWSHVALAHHLTPWKD